MKPSYTVGLLRHLIEHANHPGIAKVETFAEVGAVGFAWPPCGLKVTLADGTAVFLSCNSAGSLTEVLAAQPDNFRPEDLNVPCM